MLRCGRPRGGDEQEGTDRRRGTEEKRKETEMAERKGLKVSNLC